MSAQLCSLSATVIAAALLSAGTCASAQVVELDQLETIYIPAQPNAAETSAAGTLQAELGDLYGIELEVVQGPAPTNAPGILLGGAAVEAGMIQPGELEAVKHDGYVLRAGGNRLALSGYARQGTVYAAWALLRRLGLHTYPWYNGADGSAAVAFEPVPDGVVEPFEASTRPFFEHRDLREHIDRGRYGGTIREYTLGDPSQAANQDLFGRDGRQRQPGYTKYKLDRTEWTGWFHTAAYLIPRDIYYESNPEYFAIHSGKRIPPSRYARSQICTTQPEVLRISTERALEWMDIQKDRRFFCIAVADTGMCECGTCLAADPLPGQHTDRMLTWVNHIAAAAKEKHPDKTILTGAYINTVKPPVRVEPESNVTVMYCPWFWDSRASSDVSLASPLNVTAMKELMAWVMRFPGQVGAYDYPGSSVWGTAERVKLYAKHGIRVIYFNGPRSDLLQWINSRLVWDPFLDTEKLEAEYVRAFYGPAAEPMGGYLRLRREAIEEHAVHGRAVFYGRRAQPGAVGPEYVAQARRLLLKAAQMADGAELKTQTRILEDVLTAEQELLGATRPITGNPGCRRDPSAYARDLAAYVKLYQRCLSNCERLKLNSLARQITSAFEGGMSGLGLAISDPSADIEALLREALAAQPPEATTERETVAVRFDAEGEAGKWLSDGSQAQLISPAEMATVATSGGEELQGVRIDAPLSRLPTIPKGNIEIHAGRFYAERVLDEPLDVTGRYFLDLHLHSSRDVPVTIYVDNLHSDVDLHAGEQIVRLDLHNFGETEQFDWREWAKVERIGMDIWPQDNYYPFPEARDTSVTLLGITIGTERPVPESLPHRRKAIWLSQFRPNIPRKVAVPRERFDALMQRQEYRNPGLDYYSKYLHEGFRTFTEHRAVSPICAIVTSPNAGRIERAAAGELQRILATITGVTLPINPPGIAVGPDVGNVILLGEAAKAAGLVTDMELKYVGSEGFVINAHKGRIAIAGQSPEGTASGVRRYLEDHGVRFYSPERPQTRALSRGMLHELYLPDRPFFAQRPVTQGGAPGETDVAAAAKLAETIKDAARRSDKTVPRSTIAESRKSGLSRYVAAKLLWDPFADATRMIREYQRDHEA